MECPKVLILVLNWNGKWNTLQCLHSLKGMKESTRYSILVIDNGSTDGSVHAIRTAFPEIPILETGANLGYAGGNNAGIRWALTKPYEWILLLNNDLVVASDFIQSLLEHAQEPAILGAKIYRADDPHRIEHLGGIWSPETAQFHFPHSQLLDDGSHEEKEQVDMVCGCAFMMHRTIPELIGLLEERYFLLWEESDFCMRAKKAGFPIWTAPKAKAWHKGSASFTGGKPHLEYFWWRNRLLWIARNCSPEERRRIYRKVLLPQMLKCWKRALLKTLQMRKNQARRLRAGCRGMIDYFLGRFGNCPTRYTGKC